MQQHTAPGKKQKARTLQKQSEKSIEEPLEKHKNMKRSIILRIRIHIHTYIYIHNMNSYYLLSLN